MKTLLLIIAVALYTQPVQAGHCDMGEDPADQQHIEHHMDQGHDCCADESSQEKPDCGHAIQCGSCATGVFMASVVPVIATAPQDSISTGLLADQYPPSHSEPLFRPPIS